MINGKRRLVKKGIWKVRARIEEVDEEGKDDPEKNMFFSESVVDQYPEGGRVLLVCLLALTAISSSC